MAFNRTQFKQLFRSVFKVVGGGPSDVTRSSSVIGMLDRMADEFALKSEIPAQTDAFLALTQDQYGTHPAFTTQADLNAYLLSQVANGTAVTVPARPTGVQVDDTGNIFSHLAVPGYASASEYELEKADVAAGYSTPADIYAQGGRIYYPGITGPHSVGSVRARVKASGSRPAGESVSNATAFTGPPAPSTYTATYQATASDYQTKCGSAAPAGYQYPAGNGTGSSQLLANEDARANAIAAITCQVPASSEAEITIFGHSQNSDDASYPARRPAWPNLMASGPTYPANLTVVANLSAAGAVMSQIQQQLTNYTRPVTSGKTAVATLWGLVNDAGTGRTAAQIQDAITLFASTWKAEFPAGKLIVATEPYGHAENFYPLSNAQIYGVLAEVATWLRAGQPDIDVVMDLANEPSLSLGPTEGSSNDGLHLDEPRRTIVGRQIAQPCALAVLADGVGIYTIAGGLQPYTGSGTPAPAAPTGLTVDQTARTATWTLASGKVATDYEYGYASAGPFTAVTVRPLAVRDAAGTLYLRLKAAGSTPAGLTAVATVDEKATGPVTDIPEGFVGFSAGMTLKMNDEADGVTVATPIDSGAAGWQKVKDNPYAGAYWFYMESNHNGTIVSPIYADTIRVTFLKGPAALEFDVIVKRQSDGVEFLLATIERPASGGGWVEEDVEYTFVRGEYDFIIRAATEYAAYATLSRMYVIS